MDFLIATETAAARLQKELAAAVRKREQSDARYRTELQGPTCNLAICGSRWASWRQSRVGSSSARAGRRRTGMRTRATVNVAGERRQTAADATDETRGQAQGAADAQILIHHAISLVFCTTNRDIG